MKKTRILAVTALAAALAPAAGHAAFLNDWYLDLDGDGDTSDSVQVNEFLDVVGTTFIDNTLTGGGGLTFQEWGTFRVAGRDGGALLVGNDGSLVPEEFTATIEATGSGNLDGNVAFDSGGSVNFYSDGTPDYSTTNGTYGADDGTLFAQLSIDEGIGAIDPSGIPNGIFSLSLIFDVLLPGYLYDSDGNDMSALAGQLPPLLFGFATTNASFVDNPSQTVIDEIVEEFAGFDTEGSEAFNEPPENLVVSNNGQFRVSVPEPGSLILLGSGLLVLGGLGRRRVAS